MPYLLAVPRIVPVKREYLYPPARIRLPGDATPARMHLPVIESPLAVIAHSLFFYGGATDARIGALPQDSRLEALSDTQRHYLSFSVYSLKQMLASRTISTEAACFLLNNELRRAEQATDDNFTGMKEDFIDDVRSIVGMEGRLVAPAVISPLEFEFLARCGEAGLAQYETYAGWGLEFDEETCQGLNPAAKEEYKKALWLEMRLAEHSFGIRALGGNVAKFKYDAEYGEYLGRGRDCGSIVRGSINVFKATSTSQSGKAVDSTLKAEIGHWLFDFIAPYGTWVSELMDRMNITFWPPMDIAEQFEMNVPEEKLSPLQRVWSRGGFFLQTFGVGFPMYPRSFPAESLRLSGEKHELAECAETIIRREVSLQILLRKIPKDTAMGLYARAAVYAALLGLDDLSSGHIAFEYIIMKLYRFDVGEINYYYDNFMEKLVSLHTAILDKTASSGQKEDSAFFLEHIARSRS